MASESTELLKTIGGVLGLLAALAAAISKFGDAITKRRGDLRREDREDFVSVNDRLKDENSRCWAEIERKDKEIEDLEERLKYRRDENHWLNNQLATYVMLHGESQTSPRPKPPKGEGPDENGGPQ